MAKKSKKKVTPKPAKKPVSQAKKPAVAKGVKKAPATKAAARAVAKPAKKPTTKAKVTMIKAKAITAPKKPAAKPAPTKAPALKLTKPGLTPSTPAVTPKPAMAAKTAVPTPALAKPTSSNGSIKHMAPAAEELTISRPSYGIQLSAEELRKVKTGLAKKDLDHFRAILLEKRAEILGDVEGMEHHRTSGAGEMSHMPLHPADVGSEHYDQEFNLGLMQSEKRLLREIDDALLRIQDGTYGVCFESGKPIPRARLEIKPWAKYTIEVAMEREKRGLH